MRSLTRGEVRAIDQYAIETIGLSGVVLMENAGRNLARVVLNAFAPHSVVVLSGSGGNGGGGMVAARHLINAGVEVTVVTSRPKEELQGVPRHQSEILSRIGVEFAVDLVEADVTVDALLGYSLLGPSRGRPLNLIEQLATREGPVVALDTPSGLDVTTGRSPGKVVRADVTMTLALPKAGLRDAAEVGELLLADISVPHLATRQHHPKPPDFGRSPILRLV